MPISKYMKKLNIDYKLHIIDLIVVIIGVSVAFLISDWAEKKKEQQEIRAILNAMANEIRYDVDVFTTHQIPKNIENAAFQKRLLDILQEDSVNQDSLSLYFAKGVFQNNNWSISRSTYLTMQEAGKIAVVKSNELQRDIRTLYETRYLQSEYVKTLGLKTDEEIRNYINEKIDFQVPSTYVDLKEDRKFRNLMYQRYELTKGKIHEYKGNVEVLEEVLEKIKMELGEYYIED